jgi:uncharacterized damage-inducible protein DinB
VSTPGHDTTAKTDLHSYLRGAREDLLWKLDGLSEYEVRRPMTPTGTSLLGIVKHVARVDHYFGECFGRPFGEPLPWFGDDAEPNADFWVPADVTREETLGLCRRAWGHSDETIDSLPLDAVGDVPWWPQGRRRVTLHRLLVHMVAETHRHAGHADILRETIDGAAGLRASASNLPDVDPAWWAEYRERLEQVARKAG